MLDFTGATDDGCGSDKWSCKMCKAPVKLSPTANQHRPDALPVTQSTASQPEGKAK